MIKTLGNNIVSAFTGGNPVKAIYAYGQLVWEKIPNNTIYYTTTDNQIINIPSGYYWGDGVEIVSNTYNDVGVIIFSGDVDTISSSSSGPFRGNTRLLTITLPRSIDYIQSYAFAGCSSLKEIEIPSKVGGNLGSYCFYQCTSLVKVRINQGVTKLSSKSFRGCTSLISIEIPDTIVGMGDACFYGCTSLAEVIMYPTTPPKTLSNDNFNNNAPGRLIKVPSSSVNTYKKADGWSVYSSSIISQ